MAADHIDFWFDGQHVFLFKRDAARRSGATERHPIQLAAIPFAHHPSGNDSLLPISQPPPGAPWASANSRPSSKRTSAAFTSS
jgi:hypothetical protein